jgi:tRNA(fMet)-specific endonuclease VapC
MFVLDTNTLVYFFRGEGEVARRLLSSAPAEIAIPTVVVYELETGIAKSKDAAKRRGQLDQLLQVVAVLPFGIEEARAAAVLRARLEHEGTPIGPMDALIAGTALAHRGVLVTRNVREFGRVPGLAVQNWYGDAS